MLIYEFDDCIPVLLLSAGANPNIQTEAGFTALMISKVSGVVILLNAQADVNVQDNLGNTVLHHLASDGDNLTLGTALVSRADQQYLIQMVKHQLMWH